MRLLLHVCCAPCAIRCVDTLAGEGIDPVLFWYNPNIHPAAEYRSRKESLIRFAQDRGLPLIMEDVYGLRPFLAGAAAEAGGRCAWCYRTRLEAAALRAADGGYDGFTSTLFISPYQNHDMLRDAAETAALLGGAPFLYRDFRPRFREGQAAARAAGFFMQKYCGCIFSEEERFAPRERP